MQSVEGESVANTQRHSCVRVMGQFSGISFLPSPGASRPWDQPVRLGVKRPMNYIISPHILYKTRKWEFKSPNTEADVQQISLISLTGSLPTLYTDHVIYDLLLNKHAQLPCRLQAEKFCLHAACWNPSEHYMLVSHTSCVKLCSERWRSWGSALIIPTIRMVPSKSNCGSIWQN